MFLQSLTFGPMVPSYGWSSSCLMVSLTQLVGMIFIIGFSLSSCCSVSKDRWAFFRDHIQQGSSKKNGYFVVWGLSPKCGTSLKALMQHSLFFLQERRISSCRGCSENSFLWSLWSQRWRGWYWSRHCKGALVIFMWRGPSVVHNIFSVSTYLIYRYWSFWSFNDHKNGTLNRLQLYCGFRRHSSRGRARNNQSNDCDLYSACDLKSDILG